MNRKTKKENRANEAERAAFDAVNDKGIRTTLESIVNACNQADETTPSLKQKEYLDKIRSLSQSLLTTIGGVIEEGAFDLELDDFYLEELLSDISNQIAENAEDKGLEFIIDQKADVPQYLVGDPLRLRQVLLNLTSNAIKFTEKGTVTITVEVVEKVAETVKLQFTIRDTGVGLTRDQISKLFSVEEEDVSNEYRHRLSGLGLKTSKQLIDMMDGDVWVESELGKGSAFMFTALFTLSTRRKATDSIRSQMLKIMRVLVVDDRKSIQLVMRVMLEALSFKVTTVSSGAEAIEEIVRSDKDDPYALVIMDWMMPGMDGLEASRRIINHPELTWRPVIVMASAYGRDNIKLEAAKIGVEGFLEKPVSQAMLKTTIMELLGIKSLPPVGCP
jgi:CheY-like chemotaxis protein